MLERDLAEANGLVARFYSRDSRGNRLPYDALFDIQRRLMVLGVQLDKPIEAPDPHAPPGGSALALKVA